MEISEEERDTKKGKKERSTKKEGKLNIWIKVILQGVVGAILSATILAAITWFVIMEQIQTQYRQNQELSEKQFQQDYDLGVAKMVIDVLLAKDTFLHPLLLELLDRVADDSLRIALAKRVQENPSVPDAIKEEVIERFEATAYVGVHDKMTLRIIKNPSRIERHVEIIFLWEDTISLRDVDKIEIFLLNQGITPRIVPIEKEWYYEDHWAPGSEVAEIRYNNSNAKFAEQVKAMLDSVLELGKFKLNKTNIGTQAYSVLIILPDQTK